MTTARELVRVQRRVLGVLVGTQVLGGTGIVTAIAVSALVTARLTGSDLVAGLAPTAMVLGAAVLALPIARLAGLAGADGRRLGVGLTLLGLGWSAALVAGSTLLTDAVPVAARTAVQGVSDVAMNVGGAVGGLLAGLTVAGTSYATLGVGPGLLAIPFLVVLVFTALRMPTRL